MGAEQSPLHAKLVAARCRILHPQLPITLSRGLHWETEARAHREIIQTELHGYRHASSKCAQCAYARHDGPFHRCDPATGRDKLTFPGMAEQGLYAQIIRLPCDKITWAKRPIELDRLLKWTVVTDPVASAAAKQFNGRSRRASFSCGEKIQGRSQQQRAKKRTMSTSAVCGKNLADIVDSVAKEWAVARRGVRPDASKFVPDASHHEMERIDSGYQHFAEPCIVNGSGDGARMEPLMMAHCEA